MNKPNCLDFSVYGGELTPAEAACMVTAGIELVIAGTGHPNSLGKWTSQQTGVALSAGLIVDGYRWLNLNEAIRPQMDNAFASMGQHLDAVRMWWIDCEDDKTEGMSPDQLLNAIGEAVDYCAARGVRHGIYTGGWWWKAPKWAANSTKFSHLPLWNADYRGAEGHLPYGGWNESAIWQFTGTTMFCGQSVDLNLARNLTPPTTGDIEELVLLIASVTAGRADGVPFQTIEEALAAYRELELGDTRILQGLGETQADLLGHVEAPLQARGAHEG